MASTAARACLPAVLRRSWPTEPDLWDMGICSYVNFLLTLNISQYVEMMERKWNNQKRAHTLGSSYKKRTGRFLTSIHPQRYSQVVSKISIFHLKIKQNRNTVKLGSKVRKLILSYSPGQELFGYILDTAPIVVAGLRGRR